MTVKVLWYNAQLGYGFAATRGISEDIYIQQDRLPKGLDCLRRGDLLTCDLIPPNPKKPGSIRNYGPQAVNIELHRNRKQSRLSRFFKRLSLLV